MLWGEMANYVQRGGESGGVAFKQREGANDEHSTTGRAETKRKAGALNRLWDECLSYR